MRKQEKNQQNRKASRICRKKENGAPEDENRKLLELQPGHLFI